MPDGNASCLTAYANPTGTAAEGFGGALRKLRARMTYGMRQAEITKYMCGFFPEHVARGPDYSMCFGGSDIGFAGINLTAEWCVHGPKAEDYWAGVWTAMRAVVLILFGWASVQLWFPRGVG